MQSFVEIGIDKNIMVVFLVLLMSTIGELSNFFVWEVCNVVAYETVVVNGNFKVSL